MATAALRPKPSCRWQSCPHPERLGRTANPGRANSCPSKTSAATNKTPPSFGRPAPFSRSERNPPARRSDRPERGRHRSGKEKTTNDPPERPDLGVIVCSSRDAIVFELDVLDRASFFGSRLIVSGRKTPEMARRVRIEARVPNKTHQGAGAKQRAFRSPTVEPSSTAAPVAGSITTNHLKRSLSVLPPPSLP